MTDIVEKLALMPIGEWEEARQEILKLRGQIELLLSRTTSPVEDMAASGVTPEDHAALLAEHSTLKTLLESVTAEKNTIEAGLTGKLREVEDTANKVIGNSAIASELQQKLAQALSEAKAREVAMVAEFGEFKKAHEDILAELSTTKAYIPTLKAEVARLQGLLETSVNNNMELAKNNQALHEKKKAPLLGAFTNFFKGK